jgi:hypothetical protein
VTYKEGAAMAQKLQTLFVECSAKTKVGVQEAFEELVQKVKNIIMFGNIIFHLLYLVVCCTHSPPIAF